MMQYIIRIIFLTTLITGCGTLNDENRPNIQKSAEPNQGQAQVLFERGVTLAHRGYLVRAEQYLSLAVRLGYPEEETLPLLLQVCLSASRLRAALNYAVPFLNDHPDTWNLRFLVASIYVALDQPRQAQKELLSLLKSVPSHAPAHYLLAVIMRDHLPDPAAVHRHFLAYLTHLPDGEHAHEARVWLREKGEVVQVKNEATVENIHPEAEESQ